MALVVVVAKAPVPVELVVGVRAVVVVAAKRVVKEQAMQALMVQLSDSRGSPW